MSNIFDLFKQIEIKIEDNTAGVSWIVVGLGNPGAEYEMTRHNAGFITLDNVAKKYKVQVTSSKFNALCTKTVIAGQSVLLMKPQTYMNNSGIAISEAANFYKVDVSHILVLFDDISLPVGQLRIRRSGSAGGHNGIKSIIAHLNSDKFPRIKIGVGQKPTPDYDLVSWVLGKFPTSDREALASSVENATSALELILSDNMDSAMNKYN